MSRIRLIHWNAAEAEERAARLASAGHDVEHGELRDSSSLRALRRAVARPPAEPVVPRSTLAGYSGTPLPRKLGIKPGAAVALLGAPRGFERTLGALPAGARLRRELRGRHDLTLWFVPARADLARRVASLAGRLGAGRLWICWRKQTSGTATDVNERLVREAGLAAGLVDYKIAALDGTWSGLLFTRRTRSRR